MLTGDVVSEFVKTIENAARCVSNARQMLLCSAKQIYDTFDMVQLADLSESIVKMDKLEIRMMLAIGAMKHLAKPINKRLEEIAKREAMT